MHGENYEINCPNGETSLRQNKVYAADPGVSHLSEDVVRVGAVPLLLLPALQEDHRSWGRSGGTQPLAQPTAVLRKQFGRHPQGVLPQPVGGPARQKTDVDHM